ncbi:A/G-specific adenine glycosylase [Mucilaginibacter sp. BJC16-A38]|uniref:A/G-specific adenine glycosylase n=1 Tax=Mucilaginibacter phenanthrenivorans TaxID=1234842 RepID=UPI00215727B0|nr:A/G-specific adenine glycosylase [Mucilaginibacter phenanthrenivorans]MCR8559177.1 A/G-specific adenine glycosylase [Mucilaginibacter phenanthrenivorans]
MNFNNELTQWYLENKRDLPWRNTTDAYTIWLSEIILQQTRVEQGLPYFNRFVEKYPNVSAFAAANEDDILKLWQGLGYYSRGRNMLKTAQLVQELYDGEFPQSYDQLIKLKGIGEYTAAAIASFSANEAKAVVDGNVYRVLARYLGIDEPINSTKGKKIFQQAANDFLNKKNPGLHNQAMMEFGATVCKPKNPACGICPVRTGCYAFTHNAINTLPVKLNKLKIRERYFSYFLIADDHKVLINKRNHSDIWANMYDLPLIETPAMVSTEELFTHPQVVDFFGNELKISEISPVKKHVLTHQRLYVRLIILQNQPIKLQENWFYTPVENIKNIALPRIIFIFLKNIFNL